MKHPAIRLMLITATLLATATVLADDKPAPTSTPYVFDPLACSKLARKWIDDPFTMTMGELDGLALCARTLQALKLEDQEADQHQKAINHLYGQPPGAQ